MSEPRSKLQVDQWTWGRELIVWGYLPEHRYTLKVIEPKPGRAGCLSLQYHHEKSESWIVLRGIAWILVIIGEQATTRIMRAGDIQNLETGVIHRLMALSDDLQLIEPSTPDRHASDKSAPKDVVRLHCVHGRQCAQPRDEKEARLVKQAIAYTEEAIKCVESGTLPPEHNAELLVGQGAFSLSFGSPLGT